MPNWKALALHGRFDIVPRSGTSGARKVKLFTGAGTSEAPAVWHSDQRRLDARARTSVPDISHTSGSDWHADRCDTRGVRQDGCKCFFGSRVVRGGSGLVVVA